MAQKLLIYFFLFSFCFSESLFAHGAGVLPLFERNGEAYVGIGEEPRASRRPPGFLTYTWSDFGGGQNAGETLAQTAHREFQEETGHTSFPNVTLNDIEVSPYCDHTRPRFRVPGAQYTYREYFVDMRVGTRGIFNGNPITIQDIIANAQVARTTMGAANHVEKTSWAFVKVTDLLHAAKTRRNPIPGLNRPFHFLRPFQHILRNPAATQILERFVQSVTAAPPQYPQDVVVAYDLPSLKKQEFYTHIVQNTIPGKTTPDPYHVTLAWVEDVRPEHAPTLRARLEVIKQQHLPQTTFTATTAKRYVVNRHPHFSPIVLSPQLLEVGRFKSINQLLCAEVQQFNAQMGTTYTFNPDCMPVAYEPHITLANGHHIWRTRLNRDPVIAALNQKIQARPMEVLHDLPLVSPSPVQSAVQPQQTPRILPSSPLRLHVQSRINRLSFQQVMPRQKIIRLQSRPLPQRPLLRSPQRRVILPLKLPKRVISPLRKPVMMRAPFRRVLPLRKIPFLTRLHLTRIASRKALFLSRPRPLRSIPKKSPFVPKPRRSVAR